MFRIWASVLLLVGALAAGGQTHKKRRDYVPDEKTAKVIAEAVLVAQYGQEVVNAHLPLLVDGSNKDYWMVQLQPPANSILGFGSSGYFVVINRQSGCMKVLERMK